MYEESTRSILFITHSGNCESLVSQTRATTNSGGAPKADIPRSSALASPGATDPRDHHSRS